jgi:outer membrane protein assembly factor BamB
MPRTAAVLAGTLWLTTAALAGNWPAWRGPDGQGHSPDSAPPVRWSATENVRWKAPLPDEGNSSPVVWGDRVFITQATDKTDWPPPGAGGPASARRRELLCFRRTDGKLLWQKVVEYPEKESTHPTNPFCSASPATDGRRVVVSHGSAGMYCYDFDGKELWRVDLGKLEHIWGNASSPVLYEHLAILWCGPGDRQFLLAVDKETGKEVWRHDEPGGAYGKDSAKWLGSWSTPIVIRIGDHDELVVGVPRKLKGFDPRTGKELWSCDGLGNLSYTSPVHSDGVIVAMSGFHGPALAVRTGGKGDVTQTHRLWHQAAKIPQRIGSPVVVGEHVFILNEPGTAQCFELKTGDEVWKLEDRPSGSSWGSMVAAGGRLYVTNLAGETLVLAASPKYELIAKNPIGERVLASPAISDGELFIRSYKHLWCIGQKK